MPHTQKCLSYRLKIDRFGPKFSTALPTSPSTGPVAIDWRPPQQ